MRGEVIVKRKLSLFDNYDVAHFQAGCGHHGRFPNKKNPAVVKLRRDLLCCGGSGLVVRVGRGEVGGEDCLGIRQGLFRP